MIAQRLTARRLSHLLGDWRGGGHGYRELGDSIAILVRDGSLTPATVLPAERQLADELGISRTTVAASYKLLRERQVVISRRGSGTVVRSTRAARAAGTAGRTGDSDGSDEANGSEHGLWSARETDAIDFTSACLEPWSGLPALAAEAMERHSDAFSLIGYDTLGHPQLRRAIAERYTARGLPTQPEQIMVTLGAQHAIFLIARTLLGRGDRSLIESPSYPHAREALAATGALVAELPVAAAASGEAAYDSESILEIARRTAPRLSYLIPDHHNPTGLSMPAELRAELIDTLACQGGVIVVDETTAELVFESGAQTLPFAASATHPHHADAVLTIGSLSKTVWGGLRVGWIRASPDHISRLEASRRMGDLGTGTWQQVLGLLALERYDEILADRSRDIVERYRLFTELVGAAFPDWALTSAQGGLSVWADIGGERSTRLSREAARIGLQLVPGPRFGSPGVFERYIRLPFSTPEPELREGVGLLQRAWQLSLGPATARAPMASLI